MVLPHERHPMPPRGPEFEPTHQELIDFIERKFKELNRRLDDMEARIR